MSVADVEAWPLFAPWHVSEQECHYSVYASEDGAPIMGNRVCKLPLDERGLARSRLIAAAPYLLTVSIEALNMLDAIDDDTPECQALIERLRAAISKASGEA